VRITFEKGIEILVLVIRSARAGRDALAVSIFGQRRLRMVKGVVRRSTRRVSVNG
jgi:hypothetical protein